MASGQELSFLNRKEELLRELDNPEYRRGFIEGHAKDTIAFQLRKLRKMKQWEQRQVAEKLGNAKLQPMISRYENPDYGRYSIATLLELASVFKVALVVRFAPFSELLEWDWNSTEATLCPSGYDDDERLSEIAKEIRKQKLATQTPLAQGKEPHIDSFACVAMGNGTGQAPGRLGNYRETDGSKAASALGAAS